MARSGNKSGAEVYGTPTWVKITGAVALAVVVLIAIVIATGLGGTHGPGRHFSQETVEPVPQ
ncbi:hypothetical protein [Devosia neptuniae]|uniref:hypothetical protein n=1 Tax=Devosia neptuniae TaxID=191302 RepID=UPI0022B046B2|nr:hypothetical protein [Devosia neptuniae]MCZ4348106.1 hypothetical protein [Devosia neptuniae]